jgi:hypothetical protein
MTKLLAILMLTAAMMSTAYACDPPQVGARYQYNDGTIVEIAKPVDQDCFFDKRKACMRPVGSKQPCRWVKFPDWRDSKDGKWIDWP